MNQSSVSPGVGLAVLLACAVLWSSTTLAHQALPPPKPKREATKAPAPAPRVGTVKINTEANCTLVVNEDSLGPLAMNEMRTLQLPDGTHLLKALDETGAVRWSQWVSVRAGSENGLTIRFAAPAVAPAPLPPVKLPVGASLVAIPAGTFEAGCPTQTLGCNASEFPRRQISLTHRYWILSTPVTVSQYRAYANERKLRPVPEHGRFTRQSQPLVYVNWTEAAGYCAWMEARLPTEAEWERAAQTGPSAGVRDMGSNWEWTNDWRSPTAQTITTDPRGPAAGQNRVVRAGGSGAPRRDNLAPHGRYADVGFRCVTDRPE